MTPLSAPSSHPPLFRGTFFWTGVLFALGGYLAAECAAAREEAADS